MSIRLNGTAFKCGNTHKVMVEESPKVALRTFFSWSQRGVIEIYGGKADRHIVIYCWIHDKGFAKLVDIMKYLESLDMRVGEFGELVVTIPAQGGTATITRKNCRFMGFQRIPFDGQDYPEPLPALGTHDTNYGGWHIAGELHFKQLQVP
jgi:hypothetical protein